MLKNVELIEIVFKTVADSWKIVCLFCCRSYLFLGHCQMSKKCLNNVSLLKQGSFS